MESVLLEPSRVLRSAGADRHFSLSEEQIKGFKHKAVSISSKRRKRSKTELNLEELKGDVVGSSTEEDEDELFLGVFIVLS